MHMQEEASTWPSATSLAELLPYADSAIRPSQLCPRCCSLSLLWPTRPHAYVVCVKRF